MVSITLYGFAIERVVERGHVAACYHQGDSSVVKSDQEIVVLLAVVFEQVEYGRET